MPQGSSPFSHRGHRPQRVACTLELTGITKWARVRLHKEGIAAALSATTPGSYAEVEIPFV
jgi:hypothetical protein